MIVRPLSIDDFEPVALIHKAAYSGAHFTSRFPLQLLTEYYKTIWQKNPYAFVALGKSGKPIGFVIGGYKTNETVKQFTSTHKWELTKVMLSHPQFIFQKLGALLKASSKRRNTAIPFRLLSIAVNKTEHSQGCGKLLLQAFEQKLIDDNIKQYGLSVKKENNSAIHFYEKNNFKPEFDTNTLRYYYKILEPGK